MKHLAAGNFRMMNNPDELEELMANRIKNRYGSYNRLLSFFYRKEAENVLRAKKSAKSISNITIDSGAFSAHTQGIDIDMDEYKEFLELNSGYYDNCINLDVIGDGKKSYDNYCYLRDAGLAPIPVWHVETDLSFLERYIREAEYIAIGVRGNNQTSENIAELESIWANSLTDAHGIPLVKFHLLGVSSAQTISKYPWWSADATSWANEAWNGSIVVPRLQAGTPRYDLTPLYVPVTVGSLNRQEHLNYRELRERQYIINQISSKIAQFNLDPDLENPVTRDTINLAFYYDLAESQPEYPWAYMRNLDAMYKEITDEARKLSRMIRPI